MFERVARTGATLGQPGDYIGIAFCFRGRGYGTAACDFAGSAADSADFDTDYSGSDNCQYELVRSVTTALAGAIIPVHDGGSPRRADEAVAAKAADRVSADSEAFVYAPNELDALLERYSGMQPELVMALTRPIGTDDQPSREALRKAVERHGFLYQEIKISDLISRTAAILASAEGAPVVRQRSGYEKFLYLMQWGDDLRFVVDPGVGAMLAIREMQVTRTYAQESALQKGRKGIVYVLRNLMHPHEVALLRSVYKQRFFLLGVHQAFEQRREQLIARFIRESDDSNDDKERHRADADKLIQIDAGLRPSAGNFTDGSLNIDNTFHQADVFVDADADECAAVIDRWVDQVFGYPFGSPTVEESGMAYAYLAARSSVALGRSVGSAIVSPDGCLVGVGWNDVARPKGGLYREGDKPDHRDHKEHEDPSDGNRITGLTHFLSALLFSEWADEDRLRLPEEARTWLDQLRAAVADLERVPRSAVRALPAIRALATTRLFNLIEFGRTVHAEMAAITDAARRGVAVAGARMYVTTFPCHECARNIVAAGIAQVTYVEPYGKSMAEVLYKHSIRFLTAPSHEGNDERVTFAPYVGISPKRFDDLFSSVPRKHSLSQVARDPSLREGGIVDWDPHGSALRPSIKGYTSGSGEIDPYFEIAKQVAENSLVRRLLEGLQSQYSASDPEYEQEPL